MPANGLFVLCPWMILALVGAGMFVGLKAAYGGFGHYYDVSVTLPRTGEQLTTGSDVRMHGVIVGKVVRVQLVDRQARLTMQIDRQYQVPSSAEADITLTTLLGAKFVDLRFARYGPPFLKNGDRISTGHVGPELEDALDDGVSVLQAIDPSDLSTVVGQLTTAARGHGDDVARGLTANAQLSSLFVRTLDPQLKALHDFDVIFGALRNSAVDLNNLAAAINQGVPVYASKSAQANLDKALRAIQPFANNLSDLLILNRSDWDRMMTYGNVVLGAVADRTGGLEDLIHGLYRYVYRLGGPPCTTICGLHDGSAAAGFVNFIGGDSSAQNIAEICGALPPAVRTLVPLCTGVGG